MQVTILAAAFVAMLVAAPAIAETRHIDLPPFDRVVVKGAVSVKVEQGPQSISVVANEPDDFNELQISVQSGSLEIGRTWNVLNPLLPPPFTVRVMAPALREVFVLENSSVHAVGITGDELDFAAVEGSTLVVLEAGGGDVTAVVQDKSDLVVGGSCRKGTSIGRSGGSLHAVGLLCDDVEVFAVDGANLDIYARQSVSGAATGNSSIEINGDPKTQKLSVSGHSLIHAAD